MAEEIPLQAAAQSGRLSLLEQSLSVADPFTPHAANALVTLPESLDELPEGLLAERLIHPRDSQ